MAQDPYAMAEENLKNPPTEVNPEKDMKPLMDELDAILAGPGGGPPGGMTGEPDAMAPEGEAPGVAPEDPAPEGPPQMTEEEAAAMDVREVANALGVSEEKARELVDAAQVLPETRGRPPAERAAVLTDDADPQKSKALPMRLEELAAGASDQMAMDAMAATGMPAPAMGAPPEGAM